MSGRLDNRVVGCLSANEANQPVWQKCLLVSEKDETSGIS